MQHIEISHGNPNKVEKTVKINDFLYVLQSENVIKTGPVQIFPGVVVVFAVRNFASSGIKIRVNNSIHDENIGDRTVLFGVQIIQEKKSGASKLQLAGTLELELNGTLKKAKFGDIEKNQYKGFVDSKLIINPPGTLELYDGYWRRLEDTFYFHAGEDWKNKKIDLKLKFTLYQPRVIRRVEAREEAVLELPQNVKTQLSLPDLNRSIMRDDTTADLTLLCQGKIYFQHSHCSRASECYVEIFSLYNSSLMP